MSGRWRLWERQMQRASAQQDEHDALHARQVQSLDAWETMLARQAEQLDRSERLMDRQEEVGELLDRGSPD